MKTAERSLCGFPTVTGKMFLGKSLAVVILLELGGRGGGLHFNIWIIQSYLRVEISREVGGLMRRGYKIKLKGLVDI